MKNQTTQSGLLSFWVLLIGAAIIILGISFAHAVATEGRSIALDQNGTEFNLRWMGITNALYEPQMRTNLVHGNWDFLNTVIGTDGEMIYPIAPTNLPSAFFRVLFPQPVVTAGEPARYAHGTGGSYLYITGQFFYSGDQVRVGGILANNAVLLSPSLLRVELPPGLPPGRHDVEILSNTIGAVLASLHEAVTVVDPLVDPDRLLYSPPDAPPASPSAVSLSKKGYDYYMMHSEMATTESRRDFFTLKPHRSPEPTASITVPDNGKGINEKGIKLFDDSSTMSAGFEVVDGKKGLNAVNVKLARMAGVSNIGSSGQDGVSNIGSSGQDGVSNIGSSGQDGVSNIGSSGQDGVSLFSGDLQQQSVDLAVAGRGLDFVWARTYHSRLGRTGSATNGWTFSYDLHLQPLGGDLLVHDGTGRADRYILQTNGVYTCPEFFCEGTLSANVFRLTFADTGYWEFRSLTDTTAPGKLDRIVDRNSNTVSLTYDTAGRLSGIVDTLGRAYTVAYDTAGRLASITDFSARTVSYTYDVHGDLTACVSPPVTGTPTGNDFPNGKTNSYVYTSGSTVEAENHLLLSCADGLGQTTAQYGYDLSPVSPSYLRCTSIQRGSHVPTMITYQPQTPSTNNQFATMRCVVNDPVGNVSVTLCDARGRGIEKAQIRRRAIPGEPVTDTSTLPIDKLRQDDPDSTVTRCSWNNDSLCTVYHLPNKLQIRCSFQGDLEPSTPARKRADCRVVSERAPAPVDLDGDGTPDTSERTWTFEYDPRFGTTPRVQTIRTYIKWTSSGWDGSVKGKRFGFGGETSPEVLLGNSVGKGMYEWIKGSRDKMMMSWKIPVPFPSEHVPIDVAYPDIVGFATSSTDPRGNVTEASYDERGNQTEILKPFAIILTASSVDGSGQLIAITNAPDANGFRRVDTFTWSQGQMTACVVDAGADGLALTTAFEYDPRGNLIRCVDQRGNDWLYTYNSLDQCIRAQSPTNISARCATDFFYDANDNLVQCDTELRSETDALIETKSDRATYDALHRLTEVALSVDATHALTNRFVYDGNDQCIQMLGGDAVSGIDPHHAFSFQYDTCGLLYRSVAAEGSAVQSTTQYDYDTNDLLTRVSEGLEETPSVTTIAYDGFSVRNIPLLGSLSVGFSSSSGNLFVHGDPSHPIIMGSALGNSSSARNGKRGAVYIYAGGHPRLAQIIDPMGNVTTLHHDANDNLTVARQFGQLIDVPGSDGNIRLAESRYEYDGLDRCTVQRDLHFALATPQSPVGDGECTTTFAYAPNGACIGITNDLGAVTSVAYDRADRVYAVSLPAGKSVRACFRDAAGNVASITQTDTGALGAPPQSFTRTFAYDSQNRCTRTVDGAGNTNSCAYDSLDRVVRATDAAGTQTFHHYDLLGRCTATVGDLDGDGLEDIDSDIVELASWSPSSDRLLSTTDSHGNTTSYTHDSRDRCTAVLHADGTQEQLVWSPRSNLLQATDPNGTVNVCTYDPNNRLVQCDITMQTAGGGGGGGSGGALYLKSFSYDGCDRLVTHQDEDCDGTADYDSLGNCVSESLNGLVTASTYDALGNRLSLAYPGGRVLTYAYDASLACTNIAESGASLASFVYDGVDRLARVTYGNGLHSTFSYDGLDGVPNDSGDHGFGQVSHVVHASTNGTLVKDLITTWDLKSNKGARIIPPPGTGGNTNVLTLEYDLADRLVRSTVMEGTTVLRDTTYSLDRMGNRTNVINAAGYSGDYTLDPASPPADFQMNQYTVTPFDSRLYDANGNLLSKSSASGSQLHSFDYADRLVEVYSVVDGGTGLPSTNLVASYTYDALGRRVTKTLYSGGLPPSTRRYCYDGSCVIEEREDTAVVASYTLMHGDGSIIKLSRSGAHYFVLSDDQGNAVALTDDTGAIVEGYDYDDYGAVTFLDSNGTPTSATSSAFDNPYCWGGLRLDAETGLHNDDGGVYFEPQAGRATRGKVKVVRDMGNGFASNSDSSASVAAKHYITIPHDRRVPGGSNGNNPWSGGTPLGMKNGTVKFFNETKGFGFARKAIKEAKIIGNL